MSNTHYVRAPFTIVNIDIARDEDWFDPVPQLLDEEGEVFSLTGKTLTLYVRPTNDHSVLIYSATNGSGITVDGASTGLFTIDVPRATVISELPIGEWDQFLVLSQSVDPQLIEIWRGKLRVHAGRITG